MSQDLLEHCPFHGIYTADTLPSLPSRRCTSDAFSFQGQFVVVRTRFFRVTPTPISFPNMMKLSLVVMAMMADAAKVWEFREGISR